MSLVDFDSKLSEKNAESNTADLRGLFIQVMNSYLSAKKQSFANHQLQILYETVFAKRYTKQSLLRLINLLSQVAQGKVIGLQYHGLEFSINQ